MTHSGHDGEEASGIEQPWPGACPQMGGESLGSPAYMAQGQGQGAGAVRKEAAAGGL